jgi:hypothetical protein
VRRLVPSLLCLAFAVSLQASVPAVRRSQFTPATAPLQQARSATALPLTAAPADRQSFIAEFYPAGSLAQKAPRKTGLFRRFTTLVKKTAQKVNFFD